MEYMIVEEVIRSGNSKLPVRDKMLKEEYPCQGCSMKEECQSGMCCASFARYSGTAKSKQHSNKWRLEWPTLPKLPTIKEYVSAFG